MALTDYLCGHGLRKPDAGYFNMPKGCSTSFIVHHAKCLCTEDMFWMCGGNWPNAPGNIIMEMSIFVWNCCAALELKLTKQGGQIGSNAVAGSKTYDFVDFSNGSPLFLNIHIKKIAGKAGGNPASAPSHERRAIRRIHIAGLEKPAQIHRAAPRLPSSS